MDAWIWIVIALAVIVVIGLIAWSAFRKRRTAQLQEGFGPEYDRTVEEAGGRRAAESELREREKRREQLDIRPLDPEARDRYAQRWATAQQDFVDEPSDAVREADRLVTEVMRERGYPMDDFEQRAADVSVDHPEVTENYRAAHAVSLANDEGRATTEDLRQAMVHYRSLFEELLEVREGEPAAPR